jgi:hypothetical protein
MQQFDAEANGCALFALELEFDKAWLGCQVDTISLDITSGNRYRLDRLINSVWSNRLNLNLSLGTQQCRYGTCN